MRVICKLFAFLLIFQSISAQNNWTGDGDGTTWEDQTKWSLSHVPLESENIIINSIQGISVTINSQNAVALTLVCYDTLIIKTEAILTVDSENSTLLNQASIFISDRGVLVNDGKLITKNSPDDGIQISFNTFRNSALLNNGEIIIDNFAIINPGAGIRIWGTNTSENNGSITIKYNGLQSVTGLQVYGSGIFINTGSIDINTSNLISGSGINSAGNIINSSMASINISNFQYGVYIANPNSASFINNGLLMTDY